MISEQNEKFNIICLSNQLWDFENWTNKKHVMSRLINQQNNVIFVDPPINTGFVFFRHLKKGNFSIKRIITGVKNINKSSLIFTPLNFIPFKFITSTLHVLKILYLSILTFDKKQKTILWVYNVEIPFLKTYLKLLNYDVLVYDCVDNYPAFPKYDTPNKKQSIVKQENYLIDKADIVFTTAPGLFERIKKQNKNTFYTPNVGDYEFFKDTMKYKYKLPSDIKKIPSPRIGFIGALDEYKFDFDLLKKIANDHKDYSFILIGPLGLKDKDASLKTLGLENFSNIYYLGSKPYNEKIKYMAGFDAEIIPYVINEYTKQGCFPVKFFDSLSAGLPVVVTDLPAYHDYKDVCYISSTQQEFSDNIKKAVQNNTIHLFNKRKEVAKNNNWDNKVLNMLQIISDYINKK